MTTDSYVWQVIADVLATWQVAYVILVKGEPVAVNGDEGAARFSAQREAEKVGRENVRLVRVRSVPF